MGGAGHWASQRALEDRSKRTAKREERRIVGCDRGPKARKCRSLQGKREARNEASGEVRFRFLFLTIDESEKRGSHSNQADCTKTRVRLYL